MLAFLAVVAVSVATLLWVGHEQHVTRELARQNQDAIVRIQKLEAETLAFRQARLKKTTETDVLICTRVEALKTVIRHVVAPTRQQLLRSNYYKAHPDQLEAALQAGRDTAARFAAKSCQALPTVPK